MHAQFLRSLQAFASANPSQDVQTWQRYAQKIDITGSLSGLTAFAYAPAISAGDIANFVFATRQQTGHSTFHIFPEPAGKTVTPVLFISPETKELRAAIGFDLLSEQQREQAIGLSIAKGDIAMSSPLTLRTDPTSHRLGFLMFHALYQHDMPLRNVSERRLAFSGVVLTVYHTDEFFSSLKHGDQSSFTLRVFDESLTNTQGEAPPPLLIYDSDPNLQAAPDSPVIHHEVDFGGRNWILEFRLRSNTAIGQSLDLPTVILVSGMLGSILLSLLIFHLSTHRKRAETYAQALTSELRQSHDHLHELVAERTAKLNAALQRAQAASQAKSEFLANMSHELRTPMHAILSFSQLGVERAEADEQAKVGQYFQRIEQSATRLPCLINDLLDLSKFESGIVTLESAPTNILDLLDETRAQLESLLLAQQLQIEIVSLAIDTEIVIDAKRITQVIFNLLSNAIKFSPAQSTIRIEVDVADLPRGRRCKDSGTQPALSIRIFDRGHGIHADELESIFDKFEQGSLSRTGAGGTGLGLAISREIVTQHRGTITAKNNAGGGACFTLTLPKNDGTGISTYD